MAADEIKDPVYSLDISTLFIDSIEKSYQVNAQKMALESERELYDAAYFYYMPSASIVSQIKNKFKRPGHPLPFTEFTIDLSAQMMLWSNTTNQSIDAAYQSLLAATYDYNEAISTIFTNINQNIIKIEMAREFLSKAETYRMRMNELLKKMDVSSQSGILKKSDRLFADVALKKFEESILNVKSQVEQYKSAIDNITPFILYRDDYGVSRKYIEDAMDLQDNFFDIKRVANNNFNILSRKAQLKSAKAQAEGYNQYFTVELVTQQGVKENVMSSTKNAQNQAEFGYTFDDKGDAYYGLQVTFNGLNYATYKETRSEKKLYVQQMIQLDEYIHQVYTDLNTYKKQYQLIKKRIINIENQISLTSDVIKSLMDELRVDESNALDIFRNISSLSDLEMNRLSVQNELVDIASKVKGLNSLVPPHYVIN